MDVGSVVQLRSGGLLMTVSSMDSQAGSSTAVCHWLAPGGEYHYSKIPVSVLEEVDMNPDIRSSVGRSSMDYDPIERFEQEG